MKVTCVLWKSEEHVLAALRRLCDKDEDRKPFVVVEVCGKRERFVQFSGSRSEPLLFDAPPLNRTLRCYVEDGPGLVRFGLYAQGASTTDYIVITEDEQGGKRKGFGFLKELFGFG